MTVTDDRPSEPGRTSDPGAPATRPTVLVVTGLSGAGRSTALHALEDLGFFCIDNLPPVLAPDAVALCERGGMSRIALGIDVRVRAFLGEMSSVLSRLAQVETRGGTPDGEAGGRDVEVLFLDASDEALLRRFGETRRPHPLARERTGTGGAGAILDGVRAERARLAPLRAQARHLVDTTHLSVHDLRRTILERFGAAAGGPLRMGTRIVSFGFKYGAPVEADLVLDVRFLQNPHFVEALRPLPGTDDRVAHYVLAQPDAEEFLERTTGLLRYLLPRYEREGKSHLTVAIGCTGGRHRSVAIANELQRRLAAEHPSTIVHRDVDRGGSSPVRSGMEGGGG